MAAFLQKIFGNKKKQEKNLDLDTVRSKKTLTQKELDFYRKKADELRIPEVPSRKSLKYKRRTPEGREAIRKAHTKALTAFQNRFRGWKARENTKRLRKHIRVGQPKLGKINFDEYNDNNEYDDYDERPSTPPPPPLTRPPVSKRIENIENKQGGRKTRKRRRKRRRKTKRKGRRKTKKRRKRKKRKTRRKR